MLTAKILFLNYLLDGGAYALIAVSTLLAMVTIGMVIILTIGHHASKVTKGTFDRRCEAAQGDVKLNLLIYIPRTNGGKLLGR